MVVIFMSNNIEELFTQNNVQSKLDEHLSQAILDFAKTHRVTNADIAGVFEAIKYRMFNEGV